MSLDTTLTRRRDDVAIALRRLAGRRSVQVTGALWLLASVAAFPLAALASPTVVGPGEQPVLTRVVGGQLNLLLPLVLIVVTIAMTRRGARPDIAERAPRRPVAQAEVAALIAYGAAVTAGGLLLGRLAGDHAYSLHLPGTIHGLHSGSLALGWVLGWAAYNGVFYALLPYLAFRRRGYTHTQMGLRSSDRRRDLLLILAVLTIESVAELATVSSAIFQLSPGELLVGVPLAFSVNLVGTGLPIMVFVYALLLPRIARLTGSAITTAILGGVVYALIHLFESWTVYTSVATGTLSVVLLFLQYFGPGLIKSVLTLRTGNAWVHLWGYHAIAPHVTLDTVTLLDSLGRR